MRIARFIVQSLIVAIVFGAIYGFLRVPEFIDTLFAGKSINVLVWPNTVDAQYLYEFEKSSGIKVRISYFENYEELLVKMQSGMGDYDLVMASDYAVPFLLKAGIAKPIDKNKMPFWPTLSPVLLGLPFDPDNTYTVPHSWEMYGIGIDTNYYKDNMPEASWALLFDEKKSSKFVGMLDDAREIVSIAALYLFGADVHTLTSDHMREIGTLLQKQKKRVAMYTDLRTDYLLVSQSAPIVLGISADIYRAMRTYDSIKFLVPKEGSFLIMDMWLLPKTTKKDDWVYQFLAYLYQPEVMKRYADRFNFFPAVEGIADGRERYLLTPTKSLFSRLRLFDYDIPEQLLREIWISLKS